MEKGPRATLDSISREIGGVLGATASGELPRDEKQVSNTKRRSKFVNPSTSDTVADELFVVMQRAYAQDPMNRFIRDIKTAPEPAIVIANDQQLTDIVRFCTSSVEFGVLTVDPTFCLGDFDVTPITGIYCSRRIAIINHRYFWVPFWYTIERRLHPTCFLHHLLSAKIGNWKA